MNLTNLFRLHAVLAALYAVALILMPERLVALLSDLPLNAVGTNLARLFGAALVLVTFIAWRASLVTDRQVRRVVAGGLFIYTTLGVAIALWGQISGTWNGLGWSSVISYLIFVLGYGYFLFLRPE